MRILLGTGDVPHLIPPPPGLLSLVGLSQVQHSASAPSFIELPIAG